MSLGKKPNRLLYNLRIPEMRHLYIVPCVILVLSGMNFLAMGVGIWFWISSGVLLVLGGVWMWHEYKNALKGYGEKLSYGRLESIVTNLEDAVIAYNNNFKVLIFNAAAERIFGLSKTQVLGQIMGPEKAGERGYQILTQTLFPSLAPSVVGRTEANRYPQVVDISFDNPTMEFRVSTDRILDRNNHLLGFVKVVRDRTRETELVGSKSDFVSVAAHQLRTPLTAINWTLEGLGKSQTISD